MRLFGRTRQDSMPGSPSEGSRTFGTPSVSHTIQAFAFDGFNAARPRPATAG
jgi:hypothetical protein